MNDRFVASILLIGLEPEIRTQLQSFIADLGVELDMVSHPKDATRPLEQDTKRPLAVVLGPATEEPLRLAQRFSRLDQGIAFLFLPRDHEYARITRAIQYTPFLGDNVSVHPVTDIRAAGDTLRDAILRARQRRRFQSTLVSVNEQLKAISTHHISAIQYLDQVLDYAPVGVVAVDPEGFILTTNQRANEILGTNGRALTGAALVQLFPANETERLAEFISLTRRSETETGPDTYVRVTARGDTQYVSVTGAPLPMEPSGPGTLVILQDVTSQVEFEREREATLRLRDEFLSLAAHELKTPLTSVKGFVDLLGRQFRQAEWDPQRITRLQEQLETQVRRLELLIGDLLDASRIQQGRLELRPEKLDLADLASQVLQRFAEMPAPEPRHSLVLEAPQPVIGIWDPVRLDQVITNLVSNAIKYSPGSSEVRVAVHTRGTSAELSVRDQGVGIEPALLDRLFQPFVRGEIRSNVPGTGLGLHITSQIVEQHGGTVSATSKVGEGSVFTVTLPLDSSTACFSDEGPESSQDRNRPE